MARFDSTLDMAKTQVALRALRYGHFPADIFDEYAWDMLLHLYIAGLRQQTMYIDNIINLTSKNKMVGSRWIAHLVAETMAVLDDDKITLTDTAYARMDEYHRRAMELVEE